MTWNSYTSEKLVCFEYLGTPPEITFPLKISVVLLTFMWHALPFWEIMVTMLLMVFVPGNQLILNWFWNKCIDRECRRKHDFVSF